MAVFVCQECGKKFRTVGAAELASNEGCPGCGGVDIDVGRLERPAVRFKVGDRVRGKRTGRAGTVAVADGPLMVVQWDTGKRGLASQSLLEPLTRDAGRPETTPARDNAGGLPTLAGDLERDGKRYEEKPNRDRFGSMDGLFGGM